MARQNRIFQFEYWQQWLSDGFISAESISVIFEEECKMGFFNSGDGYYKKQGIRTVFLKLVARHISSQFQGAKSILFKA